MDNLSKDPQFDALLVRMGLADKIRQWLAR
jgi:hypothetical protein